MDTNIRPLCRLYLTFRMAEPFMVRHGEAFLAALVDRAAVLRREFAEIDAIGKGMNFDRCVQQAESIVRPLLVPKS